MTEFGNRLKQLRKEKGFTQREVAVKLNLPFSTYSNYENNNREPSFETIQKIADALGVSVGDLFTSEKHFDLSNVLSDDLIKELRRRLEI